MAQRQLATCRVYVLLVGASLENGANEHARIFQLACNHLQLSASRVSEKMNGTTRQVGSEVGVLETSSTDGECTDNALYLPLARECDMQVSHADGMA